MTNSKHISFRALSRQWHDVPRADALCAAALDWFERCENRHVERTTAGFLGLVSNATQTLLVALGRARPSWDSAVAFGVTRLEGAGTFRDVHIGFVEQDLDVKFVGMALRDAFLAELQAAHHALLLARYCGDWESRRRLVKQWLARMPAHERRWQAWQLTEYLPEILEGSGAGPQLVAALSRADSDSTTHH